MCIRDSPDGLGLELIANDTDFRQGFTYGHIPLEYSIRGFWGVELWETSYERTEALLANSLNYEFIAESGPRRRYAAKGNAGAGQYVDIVWDSNNRWGLGGAGTVHHIAVSYTHLDVYKRQVEGRKQARIGFQVQTLQAHLLCVFDDGLA